MTSIGELLRALGLVALLAGASALVGAGCTDKSGNGHFVPPPGFGDGTGGGDGGTDDGGGDDGAGDDGGADDGGTTDDAAPADASGDLLPDPDGAILDAISLDAPAADVI